ncbi:alpha/beta fold hydrolase [Rhodococcus sp. NPDC127530]|uniref:alpha/beta fold hydrolase n=1 Tax=unclassified Rhodococcus (in: high G+C Gram-positive bacteria) TaxID=192944 RepID=UPI00363D32E4
MDGMRRTIDIDGIETQYVEVGRGEPLVLLHGGEFGACAELCWENNVTELSQHFRVIAPDWLGFGGTAKVHDFVDGKARRLRHMSRFCNEVGIDQGVFVGNSMGGAMLLHDAASESPLLPVRKLVSVCGGGPLETNDSVDALFEYDGSVHGMRLLLEALFHGEYWRTDMDYLHRRYASSIAPGAWEAVAAARFKRPTATSEPKPKGNPSYDSIAVPVLIVEGGEDKLKPKGWAEELAEEIPGAASAVIEGVGHCPQIEEPDGFHQLLLSFTKN